MGSKEKPEDWNWSADPNDAELNIGWYEGPAVRNEVLNVVWLFGDVGRLLAGCSIELTGRSKNVSRE